MLAFLSHKRVALLIFALLLLGLPCVICVVWVRKEQRQYALDRQLINALVNQDADRALQLVNAGADPNTSYIPPPYPKIQDFLNYLLPGYHMPVGMGPTAFQMTVGVSWEDNFHPHNFKPDALALVKDMQRHGAKFNKPNLLSNSVSSEHFQVAKYLLQHGADPNVISDDNFRPLFTAIMMAIYHKKGSDELVRQLLKYGADPNLQENGPSYNTPLGWAQRYDRPDLLSLMQHRGK